MSPQDAREFFALSVNNVVVAQDAQIVLLSSDRGLYLGVGKDYAAGTWRLDMGNLSANREDGILAETQLLRDLI